MTTQEVAEFCENLAAPHKLLYVCVSGSKLFGTDTPESDSDYKGIYLPHPDYCYVEDVPKSITYTTGDDDSKNGSEDIDIQLWSIQNFLSLIAKGDSNALSVYFSAYNMDHIVYVDADLVFMWETEDWLYNPYNVNSFTGFARSQAVKYGIKGSRLKVMKNIMDYLQSLESDPEFQYHNETVGDLDLDDFMKSCNTKLGLEKGYILVTKDDEGRKYLEVLGKQHSFGISLHEFLQRMLTEEAKYGKRATEAMNMDGHDWKALSHCIRTYMEACELLVKGRINYPLEHAHVLKQVKAGEWDIDLVSYTMDEYELRIKELLDAAPELTLDKIQRNKVVLDLYRKVYAK